MTGLWRSIKEKRGKVISIYYSDKYVQINIRWDWLSMLIAGSVFVIAMMV